MQGDKVSHLIFNYQKNDILWIEIYKQGSNQGGLAAGSGPEVL